jgi:hypothetical protein
MFQVRLANSKHYLKKFGGLPHSLAIKPPNGAEEGT